MKRSSGANGFIAFCFIAIGVSGCSTLSAQGLSGVEAENRIAARCTMWEGLARAAAHPDAELIARHDRLLAKAAELKRDAGAGHLQGAELEAVYGKIAQIAIDARAIYDWRDKLEIAAQCWGDLAFINVPYEDQRDRLARLAIELQATQAVPHD